MSKSLSDIFVQESVKTESKNWTPILERVAESIPLNKLRLLHAAMGMQTEAGEFTDQLKKHIFYGKELDKTNLIEELGDQLWYIAIACDTLLIPLDEVMQINMKKLARRYYRENKEKGFSEEKAIVRDLKNEKNILEEKNQEEYCPHPIQMMNDGICNACGKDFN